MIRQQLSDLFVCNSIKQQPTLLRKSSAALCEKWQLMTKRSRCDVFDPPASHVSIRRPAQVSSRSPPSGTADTADAVLLGGSLPLCFVNPFSGLFHHSGSSSTVLLVLGSQCFLPFPFPEHFECVLAAGRFMWLGRGWLG